MNFLRQGFRNLSYYSECVHLWITRGHFGSRDKDGSNTILYSSIFYRTGVMGDRSLYCGNF